MQVQLMCSVLRQYPFFGNLDVNLQRFVIGCVQLKNLKDNEFVCRQGEDDGGGLYVILSGACEVYQNASYDPEKDSKAPWAGRRVASLASIVPTFGEEPLSARSAVSGSSFDDEGIIFVGDDDDSDDNSGDDSDGGGGDEGNVVGRMAGKATAQHTGQSLPKSFCKPTEEVSNATRMAALGYGKLVAELSSGDSFGAQCLSNFARRQETIIATGGPGVTTHLLQVPRDAFNSLQRKYAAKAVHRPDQIVEVLSKPEAEREKVDSNALLEYLRLHRFFGRLSLPVCRRFANLVQLERSNDCRVICRQGQQARKFCIILSGAVGVFRNNGLHRSVTDIQNDVDCIFEYLRRRDFAVSLDKRDAAGDDHPFLRFGDWVATLRVGDGFGYNALMSDDSSRKGRMANATCFTCGPAVLLTLSSDVCSRTLKAHRLSMMRGLAAGDNAIDSIDLDDGKWKAILWKGPEERTSEEVDYLVRVIDRLALAKNMPHAAKVVICRGATLAEATSGQVIYREGSSDNDKMFGVLDGAVDMHSTGKTKQTLGRSSKVFRGMNKARAVARLDHQRLFFGSSNRDDNASKDGESEGGQRSTPSVSSKLSGEHEEEVSSRKRMRRISSQAMLQQEATYGRHVASLRLGDCFGHDSMRADEPRRETVIVASDRVDLILISRVDYTSVISDRIHKQLVFSPGQVCSAMQKSGRLETATAQQLATWMAHHPFFQQFPSSHHRQVACAASWNQHDQGDLILEAGPGTERSNTSNQHLRNSFLVIMAGTVEETSWVRSKVRCRTLREGDCIDGLNEDLHVRATVKSKTAIICVFPVEQYATQVGQHIRSFSLRPTFVADVLSKHGEQPDLQSIDFATTDLHRLEFFKGIPVGVVRQVVPLLRRHDFHVGERVFSQGDEADALFVILQGTVDVAVRGGASKETGDGPASPSALKILVTLRPGDTFGEQGLHLEAAGTRNASIITRTRCVLASLPAADYKRLLAPIKDVLVFRPMLELGQISRILGSSGTPWDDNNLTHILPQVRRLEALRHLGAPELSTLVREMRCETHNAGKDLLVAGSHQIDFVYLVLHGEVALYGAGEHAGTSINTVAKGFTIGELPILLGCAAPMTARTVCRTYTLGVPRHTYNAIWRPHSRQREEIETMHKVSILRSLGNSELARLIRMGRREHAPRQTRWLDDHSALPSAARSKAGSESRHELSRALRIILIGECSIHHKYRHGDRSTRPTFEAKESRTLPVAMGLIGPGASFGEDCRVASSEKARAARSSSMLSYVDAYVEARTPVTILQLDWSTIKTHFAEILPDLDSAARLKTAWHLARAEKALCKPPGSSSSSAKGSRPLTAGRPTVREALRQAFRQPSTVRKIHERPSTTCPEAESLRSCVLARFDQADPLQQQPAMMRPQKPKMAVGITARSRPELGLSARHAIDLVSPSSETLMNQTSHDDKPPTRMQPTPPSAMRGPARRNGASYALSRSTASIEKLLQRLGTAAGGGGRVSVSDDFDVKVGRSSKGRRVLYKGKMAAFRPMPTR